MLVVPQQETVRLTYARTAADRFGLISSLGALLVAVALAALELRGRRSPAVAGAPAATPSCEADLPSPPRRIGGVIPALLLALLFGARVFHRPKDRSAEAAELYERASRAYAEERYPDAAEYARHAASSGRGTPLRDEMLCLRGESLLRAGQPALAARAFETLLEESPQSPYAAQALFSGAAAREASGDQAGARADRDHLLRAYPNTPWAKRVAPAALSR
jgi:tetratricopeptide (TPR) repeat protein